MLDQKIAQNVLSAAMEYGADFADLFVEKTTSQMLAFSDQKIEDNLSGINSGIGIRLIYGDQSLYAHSNSLVEKDLLEIVAKLGEVYKRAPVTNFSGDFSKGSDFKKIGTWNKGDISLAQKLEKIKDLDKRTRAQSELINQVSIRLIQKSQQVEIFDSEGLYKTETRPYIRLAVSAIAKDGEKQSSAFRGPGALGGWDFTNKINNEELSESIAKSVLTTLHAGPCPAGKMPVVLEKAFGGVIFHEACGHLLETTSVAKKASVFWDKKGKQIAHSAVNAVDDGTIDNEWGSISIDDEGMETQKTQLIKDGVLTNFMCDRLGEIKTGHPRTGSARRQSYKYAPTSRMRNTYIEAGEYDLDGLLDGIEEGIYAKYMGGGSVNPGTGEFNFAVDEGYIIKNGKIDRPVKGATLIGTGPEIMMNISKVGKDLELSAGMCGSVSGSVPVTVGQPPLKVDQILVGGQS